MSAAAQAPGRVPGRLGKRVPRLRAAISLAPLLTGEVPQHPAAVDYIAAAGGGWQVLGNDKAGDCAAVTWANVRRLVTSTLSGQAAYPTQDMVWQLYRTQNPQFDPSGDPAVNGPGSPADGGMELQELFEDLHAQGGPDGAKAVAFARIDPRDIPTVQAAIAIFGYVWTGIQVAQCNQEQFAQGAPWDYDSSSPVLGGHSVVTAGYGPYAADTGVPALGGDEKFLTWGQETSFTDMFWLRQCDEAWVVIWPEHLGTRAFEQGIDQEALAAAYRQLTGQALPVP
jgi:hypothetical protein